MNLLKEVVAELVGMFFGDTRMTLTVLIVVAASGALVTLTGVDPLVGGAILALGCPVLLMANLHRSKAAVLHR
jgi:hypothetical protein